MEFDAVYLDRLENEFAKVCDALRRHESPQKSNDRILPPQPDRASLERARDNFVRELRRFPVLIHWIEERAERDAQRTAQEHDDRRQAQRNAAEAPIAANLEIKKFRAEKTIPTPSMKFYLLKQFCTENEWLANYVENGLVSVAFIHVIREALGELRKRMDALANHEMADSFQRQSRDQVLPTGDLSVANTLRTLSEKFRKARLQHHGELLTAEWHSRLFSIFKEGALWLLTPSSQPVLGYVYIREQGLGMCSVPGQPDLQFMYSVFFISAADAFRKLAREAGDLVERTPKLATMLRPIASGPESTAGLDRWWLALLFKLFSTPVVERTYNEGEIEYEASLQIDLFKASMLACDRAIEIVVGTSESRAAASAPRELADDPTRPFVPTAASEQKTKNVVLHSRTPEKEHTPRKTETKPSSSEVRSLTRHYRPSHSELADAREILRDLPDIKRDDLASKMRISKGKASQILQKLRKKKRRSPRTR